MLGPSVLPELTTRRKAWEQAHGLAAQSSAWLAEHSQDAAHSQPSPPAAGKDTAEAGTAPSTAAAEAAACDLITVKHSPSLTSSSSLDNAPAGEGAIGLLKTPHIVQSRRKRHERAGTSSVSVDKSNSSLLELESSHVTDGKKLAASVTDRHISEAPPPIPSNESNHPEQPGDQQDNGDGTGGVKKRKVIAAFRLH